MINMPDTHLTCVWQDKSKKIHIWHGSQYHHFSQKIGLELSSEDESETGNRPATSETASHAPGTVVAPMAGLVVKVLARNGDKVEAGQPVLVMEAMKMEVCPMFIELPMVLHTFRLITEMFSLPIAACC